MINLSTDKNIKFYVCEVHKYARTFAFIAQLFDVKISEITQAYVSDTYSPLGNFWVECRQEGNKTILSGSGFLVEMNLIKEFNLSVILKDGTSRFFDFPAPSFVEQGTLSCTPVGSELCVKYWSLRGLTSAEPVEYSCLNQQKTFYPQSKVFIHESRIPNDSLSALPLLPKTQPFQPIPRLPSGSSDHPHLDKILALKDIHKGKDAILIGNGPSLDLNLLNKFDNHISFSFNRFYLAYGKTDFRPDYLISADQKMIEDFGLEMINNAESKVFFASPEYPNFNGDYTWLRLENIFPSLFSEKIEEFVTPGGATPYVAMQIAAYMGIKNLSLLGFDYDYKFYSKNNEHSLDTNLVTGDGNHFIKNYRNNKPWVPPSFRNIGQSFWTARLYYEALGGSIKNLNQNSSMKVFLL